MKEITYPFNRILKDNIKNALKLLSIEYTPWYFFYFLEKQNIIYCNSEEKIRTQTNNKCKMINNAEKDLANRYDKKHCNTKRIGEY